MKKSRYSDSQIMAILKQAESGTPVSELCREYGMSSATINGDPGMGEALEGRFDGIFTQRNIIVLFIVLFSPHHIICCLVMVAATSLH